MISLIQHFEADFLRSQPQNPEFRNKTFTHASDDFFFKINFLEKLFQEYHLSVKQIWVQSACKGYEQTTMSYEWFNRTTENSTPASSILAESSN